MVLLALTYSEIERFSLIDFEIENVKCSCIA